jgi:cob(I)alamin adenosyltransferase
MKKDVRNVMDADIRNVNMAIYTRTGDDGTTATYGGIRKSKSGPLFYAIGALDELTSFIGLVIGKINNEKDKLFLSDIQKNLYLIMASLSGSKKNLNYLTEEVKIFEKKIDEMELSLPKLNKFILPQGSELSSWFHILRTTCRRAERNIIKLEIRNLKLEIIRYLNRLSDLFFVMARFYNKENKEVVV